MFTRLVIEARFLRMYTCHRCGVQQQGTTECLSVDTGGIQRYTLDADTLQRSPHQMPVGWGGYHDPEVRTVFRCAACIERSNHK